MTKRATPVADNGRAKQEGDTFDLWHARLGHPGGKVLATMGKGDDGFSIPKDELANERGMR